MKLNQSDLILSIVFAVLAIGASVYFFFGARKPETPPTPEPVPLTKVALPKGAVTFRVGTPAGGGSGAPTGGFGGGGGMSRAGGPPPGAVPGGPPPGAIPGGAPGGGRGGRPSLSSQSGG